jgi:hypothetical protein
MTDPAFTVHASVKFLELGRRVRRAARFVQRLLVHRARRSGLRLNLCGACAEGAQRLVEELAAQGVPARFVAGWVQMLDTGAETPHCWVSVPGAFSIVCPTSLQFGFRGPLVRRTLQSFRAPSGDPIAFIPGAWRAQKEEPAAAAVGRRAR